MVSAQRRAKEKENLRRLILDAARELFVTEDYRAVSLRRIAEKIEYSPMAIYRYFADKQDILRHLVEEGFALLDARLEALQIADPVERLRTGGKLYLEFALTHPHYYKLMFQLEEDALTDVSAESSTMRQRVYDFILRTVEEAMAQGQFAATRPKEVVAHLLWASIHGAVALTLAGRLNRLPEEMHPFFYESLIEIALQGLQAGTA